jgi:hypothetical protein
MTEEVGFIRGNPAYGIADAISNKAFSVEWILREIAARMGGTKGVELIAFNSLLFTIVGVIMTPEETAIFSFGDGVFALNGKVTVIAPAGGNAPPYIGQRLVPGLMPEKYLKFTVHTVVPTKDVRHLLIGSDGVKDFDASAELMLPGTDEQVGPLSQFWTDPVFVNNPDAIRRRLAMANRDTVEYSTDAEGRLQGVPRIKKGLLHDDTTLLVIKREGE